MERLGPYRILRTIAMGGMGEVFLAALERSGGFEKQVALKCVLPALMADPRFVELFEKEARLAAALTHRNIVQIFDFGQDQGRSWLAMEYVRGVDLKAVMDLVDGPLPTGIAIELGIACARGLDYAHRARDARGKRLAVIHRDVSPQNVLLSFEGDVKLADFGLAQAAALGAEENRSLQGKLAYMSPEQAGGEPLDGRTDQFSLGTILCELLTGERAFFADDGPQAILSRVVEGKPLIDLSSKTPQLHPALSEVITRAMACDRQQRYPNVGAFGDALSQAAAVAGVPLGVPPLGAWLRGLFPHRETATVPKGVDPMEATAVAASSSASEGTAVALEPISGSNRSVHPVEETLAAGEFIGDESTPAYAPVVEQTAAAGDPILAGAARKLRSDPHSAAAQDTDIAPSSVPRVANPPADPTVPRAQMGPWWALFFGLVIAIGGWWQWTDGQQMALDATVSTDVQSLAEGVRLADAAEIDVDAATVNVDSGAVDAVVPDALAPDASRRVDARAIRSQALTQPSSQRRRPRRTRRDAALPTPDSTQRDAGVKDSNPIAPQPIAAASPDATIPSPEVGGPRAKATTDGGTIRIGGVSGGRRWQAIPEKGLLIDAQAPRGPRVRARVVARGGRFVSTITAKPFGQIFVDGRPMGESPKAGVPLGAGKSTVVVRTVDGHETRLTVELAH